jgi:hypothetical protein
MLAGKACWLIFGVGPPEPEIPFFLLWIPRQHREQLQQKPEPSGNIVQYYQRIAKHVILAKAGAVHRHLGATAIGGAVHAGVLG